MSPRLAAGVRREARPNLAASGGSGRTDLEREFVTELDRPPHLVACYHRFSRHTASPL